MNNSTQPRKESTAPPQPNAFGCVSRWLDAIDAGDKKAAFRNLAAIARFAILSALRVKP